MSTFIDTTYFTLYNPLSRPFTFVALELVVLSCAVLTAVHAYRRHMAGDRAASFAWLSVFFYGVFIEVISYNFFDNFTHGQFTVMFYHQKLPLYVTALYPTFIYTAKQTIGRLGPSRVTEPFLVGLFI